MSLTMQEALDILSKCDEDYAGVLDCSHRPAVMPYNPYKVGLYGSFTKDELKAMIFFIEEMEVSHPQKG